MRNVILFILSVFLSFHTSVCNYVVQDYLDYFQDIYFHTNLSGISEKCSKIFRNGNFSQTVYFDATAKLPEGIDNGNFFDLGNFDECYNHVESTDGDTHFGKYCLGFMGIGDSKDFPLIRMQYVVNETFGVHTGFCLSSHCTLEDFSKLFYKHSFTKDRCYSKDLDQELSVGAWVTIFIIAATVVIIICSTLYELRLTYIGKEPTYPSLVIFSAVKNCKKILATSNNPQQILCLNGIRTLSMMWIISHHEFLISLMGPIGNYYDVVEFYYTPKTMFLNQTPVSVDSFLTLAGILTAYTLMKRKKINLIESYVHRYFRLTPVLAMVVLMLSTIYKYTGDGPLWSVSSQMTNDCSNHWWAVLFYVQNYYPMVNCVAQTWYLGVDMQCYIVAAVIMVFLKKSSKITLIGMGFLIFLSAVISFWNCYEHALPTVRIDFTAKTLDYNTYYYKLTHTRCGPYLIGMICGYTIYNMRLSPRVYKLSIIHKVVYWVTTLTLLAACIHMPSSLNEDTVWQNALFIPLHRLVWSACLCSIILMCVTNNADFVNKFLSMPIFQVLARLSYCAYIVHMVWIFAKVSTTKTVVNYSIYRVKKAIRYMNKAKPRDSCEPLFIEQKSYLYLAFTYWKQYVSVTIVDSWGTIAVSLLISFILSMMFEMPAPDVEKYFIECVKKIVHVIASAVGMKSTPQPNSSKKNDINIQVNSIAP